MVSFYGACDCGVGGRGDCAGALAFGVLALLLAIRRRTFGKRTA